MKKNLLIAKIDARNFKSLRLLFVLMLMLSFGRVQSQCATFYQAFESFGGVISGNTGGAGLVQGVIPAGNTWTINGYTAATAANSYSGSTAFQYSSAAATSYIITPKIATLKDFSFWFRRGGLPAVTTTVAVEYSTNYTGAFANVGTATWNSVTTLTSPAGGGTGWTQYTNTFNMTNVYIRVRWSAGAVSIIDDLGWTSSTDSDNTSIVLTKGTGTCTTPALLSNLAYSFYDNGGATDAYNVSQDQTVTFTPASGERIKLQFVSNNSGASTETFTFSSATYPNMLPAWNSTSNSATPSASPYYSDYCETAVVRYQTNATAGVGSGYKITVTSDPASSCSGSVSSPNVTTATITYNTAAITWGALSGCTAPAGYDYYISNAAGTPPSGALTPSNTTALQAGYVFNSGATATGTPITGLAGSTLYYGWVRRNCSGTYGPWTAITNTGGTFTTLCAPIAVTTVSPYIEDFQASAVALPSCTYTNSGSSGIATASGNNYFYNTSTGTFIFSKPLTLDPTKIYRLSFDYGNSGNQATIIQAYYGKSDYAVSSTVTNSLLGSVSTNTSTFATSKTYFQPSSASTYYIGIKIQLIAGGALILDNIKLEVVPCWPGAKPTAISGPTSSCPGLSVSYTATPGSASAGTTTANGVANASNTPTGATWTVPIGWSVTAGNGTNTVTVTTGIIPGNVSAAGDYTGCDSSLPFSYAVTSSAIPAQPSTISGTTSFCALPNNGLVYSVTNSAASYAWSFPSGWTITAGANTNSVTVNATASAVSGTISVTPYGGPSATGCSGTPRTLAVSVGTITNSTFGTAATITPASPTATDSFRCGNRHFWYSYTVPAGCGGTFKVNLSGNGGDIDLYVFPSSPAITNSNPQPTAGVITGGSSLSASATEAVTVNLTAGSTYYILVYAYTAVLDAGGTFNLSVSSQSIGTPGPISGTGSVSCSSITNTTYSVPAVTGATGYNWTLPAGWAITSGTNTNSINIVTTGSTAGTISVIATGPCGISIPATKTITVGQIQPGTISGSAQLCAPFTATTYSISPVVGATSYIWTLPSGWSGSSTTTSITTTPSANSGNIGVSAVGPCGTSPVTTLAVVTASAVTTTGVLICAGSSGSMTSVTNPVTTFTMSDVPTSGAPTFVRSFGTPTPPYNSSGTTVPYTTTTITTTATGAGTYVFNGCASGDTFLHIYDTTFSAASPATNFLAANDDGNGTACTLDPRITIDLLASHTYVLVYSTYTSLTSGITGITIDVTPPSGVAGILFGSTDWYLTASGGTPFYSGSSFNPEGMSGSGVPSPTVPNGAGVTFYATNSLSSYCRTATTFVVSAAPTQSITPATASVICPNSVTAVSANATGTGVTTTWTSNVANTLYSNVQGSTLYVAGTNAAVVYVRSTVAVTITATSSVGSCSVSSSVTYTISPNKIWDGFASSWTPSPPGTNDAIIINNGWADGDLTGCSCTVNSGTVNFYAGETLTLTNELTVASGATVIFEDQSSLYQTGTVGNASGSYSGGNSGNITYRRTAQPMYRYDYTYWSSPVYNQNLLAVSPQSPVPFFYQYNYTTQAWQYINPNNPMEVGRGYIFRAPMTYPIFPATPINFTASFTGIPNNGTLTYPITTGTAQLNLIGNPYPSTLFADNFIDANVNLNGTLYFWTHNTYINGSGQYVAADYASYNRTGGVSTGVGTGPGSGPGNISAPSGYIGSGQGFFAKGITGTPTGSPGPYSVTFTNSMRRAANNDTTNFYKNGQATQSTSDIEKDRFWVNISNPGGFKQALIGYVETATDGLDRLFDGDLVDVGNSVTVYSILEDKFLTIQGRQLPFNNDDIVPLGYKSLTTDNCTIGLDHFDAFFDSQDIFIEDRLLNVTHNLKDTPYVFSTDAGTFNDRFFIRYTSDALGVHDTPFNGNSVKVYKNEIGLHVLTGNVLMKNVKIFDITGRIIASRDNIGASETLFTNLPSTQQVLLVQITSETGETVTKKVLF